MILKASTIFAFLFFGLWIDGCNDCNVNGNIDNTPGDICFSGIPLNLNEHSVYTVDKDGTKLREFISNGKLYSAPDINNRICRLENLANGQKNVYLSSVKNENEVKVISGNYYPDVEIPVLSHIGELISFYGGDSRLLLTSSNQGMATIISERCYSAFIPSFSADGEFLAFISSENDSLFFNVVGTKNKEKIYSKGFDFLMPDYNIYHKVSLNIETNRVIFSVTLKDSSSSIVIYDFNDLVYSEFIIENPFIMNPVFINNELRVVITGSDGNLWLKDLADPSFNAFKLTDVSGDEFCTYVDHYDKENLVVYTQLSKSGNSGSVLKILDVENKEETVLASHIFMGFWLSKEKLN